MNGIGKSVSDRMSDFRLGETAKGKTSTSATFGLRERSAITHPDLLNILNKDGTANFVVTSTTNAALGLGYHYKSDGTPEGEEQIKILEDWNNSKHVMMRGKNIEIGRYMYGMGFGPVELVDLDLLIEIPSLPMKAFWEWERAPTGNKITHYIEKIGGSEVIFEPEEIVPFTMNASADHPLGRGVLHQLAETERITLTYSNSTEKEIQRFSLYRAMVLITSDVVKLIHNGVPRSLWQLRVKNSEVKNASDKIETLDAGQRLMTNAPLAAIHTESADLRSGVSAVLGDFNDMYAVAMMSFLPKFFSKNPWTEASSLTAERIWYNALVQNFQDTFREIKVIRIDDLILQQHGFNENLTTYVWGQPTAPRLDQNIILGVMAQATTAFQAGYITDEFARNIFNELIEMLGDAGIAITKKVSTADQIRTKQTEVAKSLLDGDFTTDSRQQAEQLLELINKQNKKFTVRRI